MRITLCSVELVDKVKSKNQISNLKLQKTFFFYETSGYFLCLLNKPKSRTEKISQLSAIFVVNSMSTKNKNI